MSPKNRIHDEKINDPEIYMLEQKDGRRQYYARHIFASGQDAKEKALGAYFPNRGLAIKAKREWIDSKKTSAELSKGGIFFSSAAKIVLDDYRHRLETSPDKFKHKIQNTLSQAENYISGHLVPHFEYYIVSEISEQDWKEYVREELKDSVARLGRQRMLKYDRRYLKMILKAANVKVLDLELPGGELWHSRDDSEIKTFTAEQMNLLRTNARGSLKGLVIGSGTMGLRPIEVFGTKWEQVDEEKGTLKITVEQAKRNRQKSAARTIVMSPDYLAYVKELKENLDKKSRKRYRDSEWVYPARGYPKRHLDRYHKQWDKLLEDIGIPNVDPYTLRHTAITEACRRLKDEARGSIVDLATYFGTSVSEIERTYMHFVAEDTAHVSRIINYPLTESGIKA